MFKRLLIKNSIRVGIFLFNCVPHDRSACGIMSPNSRSVCHNQLQTDQCVELLSETSSEMYLSISAYSFAYWMNNTNLHLIGVDLFSSTPEMGFIISVENICSWTSPFFTPAVCLLSFDFTGVHLTRNSGPLEHQRGSDCPADEYSPTSSKTTVPWTRARLGDPEQRHWKSK